MKVLLTGASGFVGSHILDALCARGLPVCLLLRPTSNQRFIQAHLPSIEVRTGALDNLESIESALAGISHVIHCAGSTKAGTKTEFFRTNHLGTRNVVAAVNRRASQVQRLLHISSLAVTGPATPAKPAREDDAPAPVSDYGQSKLAAELEVREHCRVPYTILRPPAVYGPRDAAFFPLFRAIHRHLLPRPGARQSLSVVYGPDLGAVAATCLDHPAAASKTYFVASEEIVTARRMAEEVAEQMRRWTVPCPMPPALLWPLCLGQEILARLTGRPLLLNLQKYAEVRAPGWVCDPSKLKRETGCVCPTTFRAGIAATLAWYTQNGWLR